MVHDPNSLAEPVIPPWREPPACRATIIDLLKLAASRFGAKDYIVSDDRRLSYADAEARSALLARQLLAAGVAKGSRVGMVFPNTPDFAVLWLALARIGAVAVPLSTLSTAAELRR